MNRTSERAAAALDLLPEDMREPAVAYLIEQAEKFRVLQELVQEGLDDVAAGRVENAVLAGQVASKVEEGVSRITSNLDYASGVGSIT